MAGHPLLHQIKEETGIIAAGGTTYNIHLSYHRVAGVEGYVVGLKFSDQSGSMDSSKSGKVNPFLLGNAIAHKTLQMVKSDLDKISVLGFYLLTDDLESRHANGSRLKRRIYNAQAIEIRANVKHKLQYLTSFEVEGGLDTMIKTR